MSTSTYSSASTNRAVVLGQSQTSRSHDSSTMQGGGVSVGHVQFAVPPQYWVPPGPDRTTTWPAFRPVRKVSLTHGSGSNHTTTTPSPPPPRAYSTSMVPPPHHNHHPYHHHALSYTTTTTSQHDNIHSPMVPLAGTGRASSQSSRGRGRRASAPATSQVRHPLYQAHHSGRRAAAFSPQQTHQHK